MQPLRHEDPPRVAVHPTATPNRRGRGIVTASALHTLSHYVDRNVGGHDSDVPTLGLLTLVGLYGIVAIVRRSGS